MRIDAHHHFWVYSPREYSWIDETMTALRRDFLPGDLRPELQRGRFQGSIAVEARQTLAETYWLLGLAKRDPYVVGVIGWADLTSPEVRSDLRALMQAGPLVGVRHVVQDEPDDRFLLQPGFLRGISVLGELDLTYDILIYPRHLSSAAELVRRFPRQRFVLDHLAKPSIKSGSRSQWEQEIRALARLPNVYAKLSGLVTEADWLRWRPDHLWPYLDVAFDAFGPGRLMIGSDWPVCTLAGSYAEVIGAVEDYLARFPASVGDAVCGGNAQAFWRLEPSRPAEPPSRIDDPLDGRFFDQRT